MSEYFTIETEPTDNPDVLLIYASETLALDEREVYTNALEGEEGSPIAQTLFHGVEGIEALEIEDDMLVVTRDPDYTWEMLVDEIRDVLRDFFL